MGARMRSFLPVRLELELPSGASLVSGVRWVASERLEGATGTLKGEWLVRAKKGEKLAVTVFSNNAGKDRKEIVLGGGK
jgi:hypothetical protein